MSHTQTHNCSQFCANELAVMTHPDRLQHALIKFVAALPGGGVQQVSRSARRREEVYHTAGGTHKEKEPCTEPEGNRARPQPPRFRIYNGELSRYLLTLRTRLLYLYVRPGKPGHTLYSS